MLRQDHSLAILKGLFDLQCETDETGAPIVFTETDDYSYLSKPILFPCPETLGLPLSNVKTDATGIYTFSSTLIDTLKNNLGNFKEADYIVEWNGVRNLCVCKIIDGYAYLGNANVSNESRKNEVSGKYAGYDASLPFFIKAEEDFSNMKLYIKPKKDEESSDWQKNIIGISYRKPMNIYMGLFTTMPEGDEHVCRRYLEPGRYVNKKDPETGEPLEGQEYKLWDEYLRVRIDQKSRFDKKIELLRRATTDLNTGISSVTNQDMFLFPEAVGLTVEEQPADELAGWGTIAGFGLFYKESSPTDPEERTDDDIPFLWGTITDEKGRLITIERYQVPVIRKDGLKISIQ
jgi:hypothetical protein